MCSPLGTAAVLNGIVDKKAQVTPVLAAHGGAVAVRVEPHEEGAARVVADPVPIDPWHQLVGVDAQALAAEVAAVGWSQGCVGILHNKRGLKSSY